MIRLHHVPFSRSFRVLWLLQELGLQAEIVCHDIRSGAMRQSGLSDISPAARVPALEIGDARLFESGAIVEYLCETYSDTGFARAPGCASRARYLQWIHYAETMASLVEQLNLNHVFLRPPAKPSPVVVKLNTARLRQTLMGMEAHLQHDWVLEDGFSGADVMMGFNLFAAPYYVALEPFPRLQAYRARIEARPAYQRARELDGVQSFYTQSFYPVPEEGV